MPACAETEKKVTVREARLYTMRLAGVRSGDNTTLDRPRFTYNGDQVMRAIEDFATVPERCKLVLYLSDGREVTIFPSLKDGFPSFEEEVARQAQSIKASGGTKSDPQPWEVVVDVWPR